MEVHNAEPPRRTPAGAAFVLAAIQPPPIRAGDLARLREPGAYPGDTDLNDAAIDAPQIPANAPPPDVTWSREPNGTGLKVTSIIAVCTCIYFALRILATVQP